MRVLVCSDLPVCCWLLPCAVPGGGVASWAVSLSSAPIAAGGVDPLGLTFHLYSEWSWAGCSHIHWPVPSLLPVLNWGAVPQSPLASVSKSCNGAKAPYLGLQSRNAVAAKPKCCLPRGGKGWTLTPCQVPRPGLAHLPSTGLLQTFRGLFKRKTRFIKQLGFREQSFFGYVSGIGELQSPGQHLQHCLPLLP